MEQSMRYLQLILLVLTGSILLGQSGPLTLEACLQQARAHSPVLAQQPLVAEALESRTRQLNRSLWPQLGLTGQATWQSDVVEVPVDIPGLSIPTPPQEQVRLQLELQQQLWDGGLLAAQKQIAQQQSLVDEQGLLATFHQAEGQILQLFFGAILADQQRQIAELLVTDLQQQKTKVEAAVENGVALPSSIRQLEARLIELEQQRNMAHHHKVAALGALEQWTGQPISPETQLVLPQETALPTAIDRPDLLLIDRQRELVMASESLIKAQYRPKLGAFANLGYGRPGLNFLSDQWDTYAQVGAQVQIPLAWLYTGSQRLELEQNRVQQIRLNHQREQLLLQTQSARIQTREEIARLREVLAADDQLVQIRTELSEVAANQLANGTLTASDYLTELQRQEVALQQQLLHRLQLQQAIASYRWQSGSLDQ